MSVKRWVMPDPKSEYIERIKQIPGVTELTALALAARGFTGAEDTLAFLNADYPMSDPMNMTDMDKAVERIRKALDDGETIAVFGDYDVDGLTSTSLIYLYLQSVGANVLCMLPSRDSEGYGLSNSAIENLKQHNVSLIITVDNGISAFDEIAYASSRGIDTVVTDHHLPPAVLPDAVAVVDPLRKDDPSVFKRYAGVGVAAKLAAAVEGCDTEDILESYGWLVALGTISDIMPLLDENRAIVKNGLAQLADCDAPGLFAILETAGVQTEDADARTMSFAIGPRLNAAGRMEDSTLALKLLLSDNHDEAMLYAQKIEELNNLRKKTEQETTERIIELVEKDRDTAAASIIVVAAEDLHPGIIGITCSRLTEIYGKPAVVISIEGNTGRGSGRGVKDFSLYNAIASCGELLEKYGGHNIAAGFSLPKENIPEFKKRIIAYCGENLPPIPRLYIDAVIEPELITEENVANLSLMQPFGCMNDEPVFAICDAYIAATNPMGDGHSRVTIKKNGKSLTGAYFGKKPEQLPFKIGDMVDAALSLSIYSACNRKPCISIKYMEISPVGGPGRDFESVGNYRRLKSGVPGPEDIGALALNRDVIGQVYKKIRNEPILCSDKGMLFAFSDMPQGKLYAAVDVLFELDLACLKPINNILFICAKPNPPKVNLEESPIYVKLFKE